MAFTGFIAGGTNTPALRDDFDRANGAPGANWTTPLFTGEGTVSIQSNTLRKVASGDQSAGSYWNSDESTADLATSCTIAGLPAVNGAAVNLWFRIPSSQLPLGSPAAGWDFFRVYGTVVSGANNDTYKADEIVNGSFTTLTPSSGSTTFGADWAVGDQMGFTARETGGQTEIVTWRLASGGTWSLIGTYLTSTGGRGLVAGRSAVEFNDGTAGTGVGAIDDLCVEAYEPTPPVTGAPIAWIRA